MQKSKIATLSAGKSDVLDWESMENADFLDDMQEQGKRWGLEPGWLCLGKVVLTTFLPLGEKKRTPEDVKHTAANL